ncbi:MAG: aspartate-semialdehyde dehydrogenase [Bacteroidetes bacterium]|nr:aspartate-semialdehyde dehydrogenase [Bacteroidota bacterium]
MRVAVVGATGLVGGTMLRILEERKFPVSELLPVASERSAGSKVSFAGKEYTVLTADEAIAQKPALALFSAGGGPSLKLAPLFAEAGCRVIDNSSAWRMDPTKKLIVPEVNGASLTQEDFIISNPNCSTIQMVMMLRPLQLRWGIRRVVVSTYQSVTGTGQKAVHQLLNERAGNDTLGVYPYPIDLNLIPQIDVFGDNDTTKEELKMMQESGKILGDDQILISATCVRVPVMGGHSESLNVELKQAFEIEEVKAALAAMPGVIVQDNPTVAEYPMPLKCAGRDEVFVGRIRRDLSQANTLNCWVVADNLRKGAATNAVQIAEWLLEKGWLPATLKMNT